MKKVAIVIPTIVNYSGLIRDINSLKSNKYQLRYYIIDNSGFNNGVAKSWNMGIKKAIDDGIDTFIISNDDIEIHNDHLDRFIDLFLNQKKYGLISGIRECDYDPLTVEKEIFDNELGPDFAFFILSKKTYEKVGKFDEKFYPAYFEDGDFNYRCKLLKIKTGKASHCIFSHGISSSIFLLPEHQKILVEQGFVANSFRYIEKWGGGVHSEIYKNPYNKD